MRHVIRQWTEIRHCEFPDDAPVYDEDALAVYVYSKKRVDIAYINSHISVSKL
jgi:hypothetical protein